MRYDLYSRDGKRLGTVELEAQVQEFWRAMQRLQVQLRPAPVAPVVTATSNATVKRSRKLDDAT